MRLFQLADASVGLVGFGREGRATLAALRRTGHRGTVIVLDDAAPAVGAPPWRGGEDAVAALPSLDVLVASPGVPPRHPVLAAARARGMTITTATNLFLAECRAAGLRVVAVTGSKGKSTTSTLLHLSLGRAGRESVLAGNVGVPALDALDDAVARRAIVVLETSSYQAALLDAPAGTVIVTELFPEHLDWHGSEEAYFRDKLNLARRQEPGGLTIWNGANEELRRRAPLGPARHEAYAVPEGVSFESGRFLRAGVPIFGDDGMLLRGAHNRRNACAVLAAAASLGVADAAVREVLCSFGGLPHRLQDVGVHAGLRWIDDSISTAPEAAVAAIEAFGGRDRVLVAGGHDRGFDFAPLARAAVEGRIAAVALLPPSGLRLARSLRAEGFDGLLHEAADLEEAVSWTAAHARPGAVVLFSPASPSYGAFRNFEERGNRFQELVRAL